MFVAISTTSLCFGSPPRQKAEARPIAEGKPAAVQSEVEIGTERHPLVVTTITSTEDQAEKSVISARDERNAHNGLLTTIFTGISASAALLQLVLFAWQLRLMRRSLEDTHASADAARVAARAAELNARAAIGIELPVLRVRPPDDIIQTDGLIDDDHAYGGTVNDGPLTQFSAIGLLKVENHGRTPAFPNSISVGWQVAHELPETPNYKLTARLNHSVVVKPDDEITFDQHYGIELTEQEIASCAAGTSWLWFYGELTYRDFLYEEHKHRFCWRHADRNPPDGPAFFFFSSDGEPPPAYIRSV
ncbi:hypothetical protein ACS7SF_08350 [Ralstonia sp. 25C]|uniref:hypothetical protein n=1 Tax=Ralstonia sp. 25C TaxID=3447363 RepID=UPI003F754797